MNDMMIERVARVMFQRFFEIGAEIGISEPPIPWEVALPEWRKAWMQTALAAMQEMERMGSQPVHP